MGVKSYFFPEYCQGAIALALYMDRHTVLGTFDI